MPDIVALPGGHVDGILTGVGSLLPYVEAEKMRIFAVSFAQSHCALPDVPTFRECGFDLDISTWFRYIVPKGTPKSRCKALHDALKVGMDSKDLKTTTNAPKNLQHIFLSKTTFERRSSISAGSNPSIDVS